MTTDSGEPGESGADSAVPETSDNHPTIDITSAGMAGEAGLPGLRAAIEAVLMVVDAPVTDSVLAQVLERPREEVATALAELAASYVAEGRGFELREDRKSVV